ncbi:MAG TPA: NAD(P)H-dependent oxidoreductase [Paucimonas sp.]|nr:NAD(P)H-dependent oxidoreductase [Paucimonas sp.]
MSDRSLKTIVGLGGSLRAGSYSHAALRTGLEIAERMGARIEMLDLRELDLPMYVPDQELEAYPARSHAAIARLVAACRGADAMLWSTPTYHGAMSGALKNAIDYLEFLARDPSPYFQGRAIGLVSISDSSPHAGMANCVNELRAWLAPTRVTLDAEDFSPGPVLTSASGGRRLTRLITELLDFK